MAKKRKGGVNAIERRFSGVSKTPDERRRRAVAREDMRRAESRKQGGKANSAARRAQSDAGRVLFGFGSRSTNRDSSGRWH